MYSWTNILLNKQMAGAESIFLYPAHDAVMETHDPKMQNVEKLTKSLDWHIESMASPD